MLARTVLLLWMPLVNCFNLVPQTLLCEPSIRILMKKLYPNVGSPTIEHCVPKSFLFPKDKRTLSRDMHGIICLPSQLNCWRSNYKLVECPDPYDGSWKGLGKAFRHERLRLFCPPTPYRGLYARSIGYFALTYPPYAPIIHASVLDFELLVDWSSTYPLTENEKVTHAAIASVQRNENPFVTRPRVAERALFTL